MINNLVNSVSFLDDLDICSSIQPVLVIVGYVIMAIKIFVPIALIVIGMIKLAQAITEKDDSKIKTAQSELIKKLIVGVIVFLVPTIVTSVMSIIGHDEYKNCWSCINDPSSCGGFTSLFTDNWLE